MAVFGFLGIKMVWIFFWANKNLVKAGVFFWGDGRWGESLSSAWWWLEPWNFEWLSIYWESYSQLTNSIIFQRGRLKPPTSYHCLKGWFELENPPGSGFFVSDFSENLVWKQVLLAPNVPHDFCPRNVIDFRRSMSVSPRGFDRIWTRHWTSISKSSNAPNERNPKLP